MIKNQAPSTNRSETLVVRFLMHYGTVRRSALLEKLNRLALQISDGNHGAFTFRWAELRPEQLPWMRHTRLDISLRELNALKNALHGMLRQGVSSGLIDAQTYLSIIASDLESRGRSPRSTG